MPDIFGAQDVNTIQQRLVDYINRMEQKKALSKVHLKGIL